MYLIMYLLKSHTSINLPRTNLDYKPTYKINGTTYFYYSHIKELKGC